MPRSKRNPDMARSIGARVRLFREATGITQERLAWDCDLDRAYVGHIEAGRRLPSLPVLTQIAARLGVHVVNLIAADPADPVAALLEAVRQGDRDAVRACLDKLGLA